MHTRAERELSQTTPKSRIESVQQLEGIIKSSNSTLERANAIIKLNNGLNVRAAHKTILHALGHDKESIVRHTAARVLGMYGASDFSSKIRTALDKAARGDSDLRVREEARISLITLQNEAELSSSSPFM